MSLQVWLPLNGDLHNQGLNKVIPILMGSGITYTAGKIGQAVTFPNNCASCIHMPGLRLQTGSFAAWILVKGTGATSRQCIISEGRDTSNDGVEIYTIQAGTTIYFKAHGIVLSTAIELNKWYHIVGTFGNGIIKLYLNGILKASNTYTADMTYQYASDLTLGKMSYSYTSTSNYFPFNGQLNDVRIYNHCLSAAEIEEISKGLILHYQLNQNINILNNCYNYPTFNTSSSSGGWSHWGPSGHSGTFSQNTDKKYIYNKSNMYSHCVDNTASASGKYYLCYQSPAFEGGYRSLQFIVKEANELPITETICVPGWNARNGGAPSNKWTRVIPLGDNFYLCQVDGLSQDGSNDLVSITVQPGYKIYVSEGYCENDREICSNLFIQDHLNIIYDSSGYNHNGTITGQLEIAQPSPKFNYATYINSPDPTTNSATGEYYILADCGLTTPSVMSVAWWANPESGYGNTINHAMWCTTALDTGADYQTSAFNHRDAGFDVNSSDNTHLRLSTASFVANEWHHYVVTYDGQTAKLYKDGTQQSSVAFSAAKTLGSFTKVIIGHSRAGSVHRKMKGKYSDFRIYATALTATQVKDLYRTSMIVDGTTVRPRDLE